MKQKHVRITQSSASTFWYADSIGCVYPVSGRSGRKWKVKTDQPGQIRFIEEVDCQIFDVDLPSITLRVEEGYPNEDSMPHLAIYLYPPHTDFRQTDICALLEMMDCEIGEIGSQSVYESYIARAKVLAEIWKAKFVIAPGCTWGEIYGGE